VSKRSRAFTTMSRSGPGSQVEATPKALNGTIPDWPAVEALLERLAESRAVFQTTNAESNWISSYEPGRRLMLESGERSRWIRIDHLQECWETFERLGRITRLDVLEPGRASTFVMALFAQVSGVRQEEKRDDPVLVLPKTVKRAPAARSRAAAR